MRNRRISAGPFVHVLLVFLLALGLTSPLSAQTVGAEIDAILNGVSGNTWSVVVENQTGTVLHYSRNPTTVKKPASNTKMYTTAAAYALLGEKYRFQTDVLLDGSLDANGHLTGHVVLLGRHDFTWATSYWAGAREPLDELAKQCYDAGLRSISGDVYGYGVCLFEDSISNATAATQFLAALKAAGISTPKKGRALGASGFNPPGSFLTAYQSIPLDMACVPLNKSSVNVYADILLRHIGWTQQGSDTYAAGATEVIGWLQSVGISTTGVVMQDGSGLSHNNRFSARQTIELTRHMLANYPTWGSTLSIGCQDGTIGARFCGTLGATNVYAKTGTLTGVVALSGYIYNTHDGRKYFYSFLANDVADSTATRQAIDDAVLVMSESGIPNDGQPIAGPEPPRLLTVKNNGDGDSISIAWEHVGDSVSSFNVYTSSDGATFGAPVSLPSTARSYTATGLTDGQSRFFKVTAVGTVTESGGSDVYGAAVTSIPSEVLIVDGNDRWLTQFQENPYATNHAFAASTGAAISGRGFDTADNAAVVAGSVSLTSYDAVVWTLGEESTIRSTFSPAEQTLVASYLDGGGNLFVSGAEIGWDLVAQGTAADTAFYNNYLKASYVSDDANTFNVSTAAGGIFAGIPAFDFFAKRWDEKVENDYPDVITTTGGSIAALTYAGGNTAGISYNGSFKIVNFGFAYESISTQLAREDVMDRTLSFFLGSTGGGDTTPPAVPTGLAATAGDGNVALDWNDNTESDLLGYNVHRSTTSGGTYTKINGSIVAGSAYNDATVSNGTTYYYVVTAVDTSNNESGNSNQASAMPAASGGNPTTMSVSSIVLETVSVGGGNKKGRATVVILDNNGAPVNNATVTGTFSGGFSESAVASTNSSGQAVLDTIQTKKGGVTFTFCVDGVSHSTLSYNASANVETCDSI